VEIMAIERVHDDIQTNARQRILKKGTIEARLSFLESAVQKLLTKSVRSKLSATDKEFLKQIESVEKEHPREND